MSRYDKDKELGAKWFSKIRVADQKFETWERKFRCKDLEKYYEGFQWKYVDSNYEPYTLNLIFSTFNIKRPTMIFKDPIFFVDPRPGFADFNSDAAYTFAQNATDLLNTQIANQRVNFGHELEMAVLDAGPYFGVIEVGYDARWIRNPNAGMPIQKEDHEYTTESEVLREPEMIPEEEWVYVKRIPAHRFRVSGENVSDLQQANWCGYYEFIREADLKDPQLKFRNISHLPLSQSPTEDYYTDDNEEDTRPKTGYVKIWKIWDLRAMEFYIFHDGEQLPIYSESFKRLPLFPLRVSKRRKGWYPIPWFFNWKSPQDEINETREQIRAARRRTKRIWQVIDGGMADEEVEKLITGPDGTVVRVLRPDALNPVLNPPVDAVIGSSLQISKDDFNIASATSSEMRGQSDRTTATQAKITETRSQVRDLDEREIIALWMCNIGREVLEQAREHMTQETWVKTQLDLGSIRDLGPTGAFFAELPEIQSSYRMIKPDEDLGNIDFKVQVSVEALSPVANDQAKVNYLEFLALMQQYPIISVHPALIQETAYKVGYRNLQVIRYFQQAAMMQMAGQMLGASGMEPQGSNVSQRTVEQMNPPTQAEIENQIAAQGVPQ